MISPHDILRAKAARLLLELDETQTRVASLPITADERFDRKVDFLVEFLAREFPSNGPQAENLPFDGDEHPHGVERWTYTGNGLERAFSA